MPIEPTLTRVFLQPPLSHSAAAKQGAITITAVWSRTPDPATALAAELGAHVRAVSGDDGLTDIEADTATDAVISILPVQVMPDISERMLAAGKHVLQEKPVAPTVQRARALIAATAAAAPSARLCIAENYRSEPGVIATAAAAATAIGAPTAITLTAAMPMDESNRYFGSEWRRDAVGYPGTFLMDSSCHWFAALRSLAAAVGAGEAVRAGAVARRAAPSSLPPPADTLAGWVEFQSGVAASIAITFAGATPTFRLMVDGTAGAVEVARGGLGGGRRGGGYSVRVAGAEASDEHHPFGGLEGELTSFVAVARGTATPADEAALSVAAAAADLAVVEALLASAAAGGEAVEVAKV